MCFQAVLHHILAVYGPSKGKSLQSLHDSEKWTIYSKRECPQPYCPTWALLGSQIVKEVKIKATAEKFEPASAIIEAVMTDTKYCVYIIFV